MKTFAVYLLGRDQPVEVKADWFALVGDKGELSYRFKVKTAEGSEVIGETPACEPSPGGGERVAGLTNSTARFEHGRVQNRPEMDEPSEKDEPQNSRKDELDDRHQQSPLDQLPEARDEETAQRRDHVPGRTLSCHGKTLQCFARRDKLFFRTRTHSSSAFR